MSSLQQSSRFIPFTNSAQRSQLLPGQGTFPQSLSGSETDVSTSNENLSHEERYVIKHTARQEPQGQENLSSNRSSLDVSSSSYNTLIIHGAGDESWTGRLSGIRDMQDGSGQNYLSSHSYSASPTVEANKKMGSHSHSPSPSLSLGSNKEGRLYDPSVREITEIPDDYLSQSQVLKHLAKEVKVVPCGTEGSNGIRETAAGDEEDEEEQSKRGDSCDRPERLSAGRELTPRPPPEYPKWLESPIAYRLRGTGAGTAGTLADKISLSRSQPDLSRIGASKIGSPRPKTNGREDMRRDVWPPAEMVEILIQENSSLKLELETCYQKVAKSQKLEQEIAKVHRAHEELVQGSERRERLERAARTKLQAEVRRLQEANRALREQAELLSAQLLTGPRVSVAAAAEHSADSRLREELNRREILVAQLITQNKELAAAKERQEIELAAQRATLQEQRTHIDILDTALTNAQSNVVRLEEECRKKQVYVERVAQLQRALSSLQLASERREQTERKLRQQLEQELRSERGGGEGAGSGNGADNNLGESSGNGAPSSSDVIAELKRQLRERDDRLVRLEGEVAKWEQRYLEESALRQAAIDAASIPKDAKIAALEKTSQETEKLIAEARSEKIRHMDEVHAAQKKVADLESRLKDLESKLAERDAMIRVLQKHTYDKDVSSFPSMLVCSPHHTPHPSLHGNSDLGVLGTSVSREELVSGASCSTGISSYTGSCSDSAGSKLSSYHRPLTSSYAATRTKYGSVAANKSFDETNKSLDDQLKELDSQLDSQLLSKSTYCSTLVKHAADEKKIINVVNLDPAAEFFDYDPVVDIRQLIHVDDAMEDEELKFGPNGGLVFCMEYLVENIDWLEEQLGEDDDDYILFDCPGQIELYTHMTVMRQLVEHLQRRDFRLCAVFLIDSQFMVDPAKFLSGTMAALSVMTNLELPHINVLSKMDLLSKTARSRLDSYLEPDPHALLGEMETTSKWNQKYNRLTEAIGRLIEDYSLVRFYPFDVRDEENIADIMLTIDNMIQYGEDADVKTRDFEYEEAEDNDD